MANRMNRAAGTSGDECVSASLDLFTKPLLEMSVDKTYFSDHTPAEAIANTANSIEIGIPPSRDMTDLAESYIEVKVKITKNNGQNLDAFVGDNSVGFDQIPITSLFKSFNFRVEDELLSDTYSTYPYVAYIQTILNYGADARKGRLRLMGYYDEENVSTNEAHDAAGASGFKSRAAITSGSKKATFIGNIFHGLWSQNRYLLPMLNLRTEWIKSDAAFCLKSNAANPTFKFKIESLKIFMKKIKLRDAFKLELEERLLKEPASYPLCHATVKPFYIAANEVEATFENLFQSKPIPSLVIIGFVKQANLRGAYADSAFNFEPFHLESLEIQVDDNVFPSPTPFKPKYDSTTEPDWTREYLALNNYLIKLDTGNLITYDMFKTGGYCLYVFHLGREFSVTNDHTTPKKSGVARLAATFASGSNNPALAMMMYTESNEEIQIDSQRKISRDYYL